jgi:hypothetical protein
VGRETGRGNATLVWQHTAGGGWRVDPDAVTWRCVTVRSSSHSWMSKKKHEENDILSVIIIEFFYEYIIKFS